MYAGVKYSVKCKCDKNHHDLRNGEDGEGACGPKIRNLSTLLQDFPS